MFLRFGFFNEFIDPENEFDASSESEFNDMERLSQLGKRIKFW